MREYLPQARPVDRAHVVSGHTPGLPADAYALGGRGYPDPRGGYADTVEALRRDLGLDKPLHEQYLAWIGGVLQGDLGRSLWTKEPILVEFARRFPVTIELTLLTIIISVTFGLGVGILSAIRQETWVDYLGRVVAILALAVPYFWVAILVVVLPAIYWRWTPLWTYVPLSTDTLENLKIMIFPAAVFGVSRAGPIMRITRSAILEVQRQDYIRTAWAKGLPERSVILKHAIKNALIPVVSIIGLQVHFLSWRDGDYRVHLPAARHGEFLL